MIATALVTPIEFVPVHLLNPTGKLIVLYPRANVVVMSEISEVKDDNLVSVSFLTNLIVMTWRKFSRGHSIAQSPAGFTTALLLEYSDVFAISKGKLGYTVVLQHEIVTENVSPIHQKT